jgi:hypothetical protein
MVDRRRPPALIHRRRAADSGLVEGPDGPYRAAFPATPDVACHPSGINVGHSAIYVIPGRCFTF